MSKIRIFSGNSLVVRSIMPVQPQNRLSGVAARTSRKRITAPAVFLCAKHCHNYASMVGRAGEPKGSPGSFVTGTANLVRLTTPSFAAKGGDSKITKGVQP